MKRSMGSASINFGLLSIPVKFYTSTSEDKIKLNFLSPKTKNKLKQKLYDPETGEEFVRPEALKGFEYTKNKYVVLSEQEIAEQNTINKDSVNIVDFTQAESINKFQINKYYYLSPNKGADKAYKLFSQALEKTGKVAIGTWAARSKEHLVMISPANGGLILAQLWYSSEVSEFEHNCANVQVQDKELELAIKLIEQESSEKFDISVYYNKFVKNVHDLVNRKVNQNDTVAVSEVSGNSVLNLLDQLKSSLEKSRPEVPEVKITKSRRTTESRSKSLPKRKRQKAS